MYKQQPWSQLQICRGLCLGRRCGTSANRSLILVAALLVGFAMWIFIPLFGNRNLWKYQPIEIIPLKNLFIVQPCLWHTLTKPFPTVCMPPYCQLCTTPGQAKSSGPTSSYCTINIPLYNSRTFFKKKRKCHIIVAPAFLPKNRKNELKKLQ